MSVVYQSKRKRWARKDRNGKTYNGRNYKARIVGERNVSREQSISRLTPSNRRYLSQLGYEVLL